MYYLHTRNDMVRIPPDRLDEDINKVTMELAHQAFEGRMGPDQKLVVLITNLELTGDSRVVHGDGAVYQPVRMDMLLFDVKEEGRSRNRYGGLSNGEYMNHIFANTFHFVSIALIFSAKPAEAWSFNQTIEFEGIYPEVTN